MQEDFRLFDQGKLQLIAKFSVVQSSAAVKPGVTGDARVDGSTDTTPSALPATSAKSPVPDHYVAYVFDDIHLNFENLAQVRAAAQRHFESLAPTAHAAIYTTSGRVTLDFMEDRESCERCFFESRSAPTQIRPRRSSARPISRTTQPTGF